MSMNKFREVFNHLASIVSTHLGTSENAAAKIPEFLGVKKFKRSEGGFPFPLQPLCLFDNPGLHGNQKRVPRAALVISDIESHQPILVVPPRGIVVMLTGAHHSCTLISEGQEQCLKRQPVPLPRRMRTSTLRLRPRLKKSCLSRIRRSRLTLTPRSEHGNGAGSGIPATLSA